MPIDPLLSAEEQVLEMLIGSLVGTEDQLSGPINTLISYLQTELAGLDQSAAKISKKLKAAVGRNVASNGNDLDLLLRGLSSWLNQEIINNEILLSELAVKGGVIQPGKDITTAMVKPDMTKAPIQWAGQLLLDTKSISPTLDALIEVLREIRDRLSPLVSPVAGETPETAVITPDATVADIAGVVMADPLLGVV